MSSTALFQAPAYSESAQHVDLISGEQLQELTHSQAIRLLGSQRRPKRVWRIARQLAIATVPVLVMVTWLQPWKEPATRSARAETVRMVAAQTVRVERPAQVSSSNVVLPATVRPWQTTTIHARANGYVTAWHKELGDRVKVGQLLAEIETPELDREVAEAEASAREARAAVVQAQAEREEAAADLKVAQSQWDRAQAEVELTKTQLARREKLLATRTITREEFDVYQRDFETRSADEAAARSDVARRRTNLDTRAAIIAAREATAKSRQANLERLQALQDFKRIVAPFDGVVTRREVEVGMLVTAGKESLYTIEDMSRVRVQASVPQTYAAQTRPGVSAKVRLPESSAKPVAGTITRIADSVDATSRTMLAEIELDNASGRLQPGSYVQIALTLAHDEAPWTIPTSTVQMRVEGSFVAAVDDTGKVELKQVRLGRDLGGRVVAEGLRGDERLIVNPNDNLTNGSQVEVGDNASSPKLAQR
jgi:multidrug efflux pump subunit AcrA (membrane-fusion protein)